MGTDKELDRLDIEDRYPPCSYLPTGGGNSEAGTCYRSILEPTLPAGNIPAEKDGQARAIRSCYSKKVEILADMVVGKEVGLQSIISRFGLGRYQIDDEITTPSDLPGNGEGQIDSVQVLLEDKIRKLHNFIFSPQ